MARADMDIRSRYAVLTYAVYALAFATSKGRHTKRRRKRRCELPPQGGRNRRRHGRMLGTSAGQCVDLTVIKLVPNP